MTNVFATLSHGSLHILVQPFLVYLCLMEKAVLVSQHKTVAEDQTQAVQQIPIWWHMT